MMSFIIKLLSKQAYKNDMSSFFNEVFLYFLIFWMLREWIAIRDHKKHEGAHLSP